MRRALARLCPSSSRSPAASALAQRRPVRLVTTGEQCQAVVERLLSSGLGAVGVDCEGPQLGRFGRLSLVQLATEDEVFLLDVAAAAAAEGRRGPGLLLGPLGALLESREVTKVFHDCREDAALLFHRHGTSMAAIFDTQVAFAAWLEHKGLEPHQASLGEVLRTFRLSTYRAHRWDELERKPIAPQRWQQRPLEPQAIRYAVEGVAHLLPLRKALCRELGDPAGDLVLRRSVCYLEYAHLNCGELPTEDLSGLKPGAPLRAMLASRKPDAAYFKLNHGALTGAVLDSEDLKDFKDLKQGDIASCRVRSLSECRQFVHLRREGHGNLFFDRQHLEMRSLPSAEEVDAAFPSRQSSFYGLGKPSGRSGGIAEERSDYRERKPEIYYKAGKRPRERKTGIKPPQPRAGRPRPGD